MSSGATYLTVSVTTELMVSFGVVAVTVTGYVPGGCGSPVCARVRKEKISRMKATRLNRPTRRWRMV